MTFKKMILALGLAAALLLSVTGCGSRQETAPETETSPEPQTEQQAPVNVTMEVQDYGTIELELDPNAAPKTVANFVDLVNQEFYDGLTFHRIISGFMIQGGDPLGTGMGGSDENVVGEFSNNGWENPISHVRGTISMARARDMDSASSQFFIVHEDSTFLDGDYAAFGHVTSGMEVVDAICEAAQPVDGNGTIQAEDQPVITSIRVVE